MTRLKLLLAAGVATTMLATGAASAATRGNRAALKDLPTYSGTVAHFTITPRGAIDGMILSNGTEVLFPPYLSTEIAYAVKQGDQVTVRGLKAAGEPVIRGVTINDATTHQRVVDNGPPAVFGPHHHDRATRMMADGKVAQVLYDPGGRRNGLLLENGTVLHLPPPEFGNQKIAALLKPGATVAAVGAGTANALGKVVMVRAIGPSFDALTRIAPPHRPHRFQHRGPMAGPGAWHHAEWPPRPSQPAPAK